MDMHAYYYSFYQADSLRIAMYELIGITHGSEYEIIRIQGYTYVY